MCNLQKNNKNNNKDNYDDYWPSFRSMETTFTWWDCTPYNQGIFWYNQKSWEFDIASKRIISWLSNHQLTYEDSDKEYRIKFDHSIQKQTNHLLNEIKNSIKFENKMIGCAAIILTGLAYQNDEKFMNVQVRWQGCL